MIIVTFFEIETCRPSQAQTWPRHTLVHIEMPSITSNNRAPAKRLAAILVTTWGFTWQGCRLLKILRPLELENNKVQGLANNRKSPVHPKWLVSKHLRQNNAKHDSHQSKSFQAQQKKKTCSLPDANSFGNKHVRTHLLTLRESVKKIQNFTNFT